MILFLLVLVLLPLLCSSSSFIIQPITFINFYRKSDGIGKVSYDQIKKQVDVLNDAFSGNDARRAKYKQVRDTNIRFQLVGVRFVANDEYHELCILPSMIAKIRPLYMMDPQRHLNVYICWNENMLGSAYLPDQGFFGKLVDESHYIHGAIIHYDLLPGNTFKKALWSQGKILVHEIGHFYGLRHPYDGDCLGSDQDGIADTPRMSGNPLAECKRVRIKDSCKQHKGRDDLQNYMLATADKCRNHFTPGQVDKIWEMIREWKPTLLKQLPFDYIACSGERGKGDSAPDLEPCISEPTLYRGTLWCYTDRTNKAKWAWACRNSTEEEEPDFNYTTIRKPPPFL